jgi:hypothetical protein
MGGELLLLALGGCFMSNPIAAARARDLQIDDLSVDVQGTLAAAPPRLERQTTPCGLSQELSEITEHGGRRDGAHNIAVERTRPRAAHRCVEEDNRRSHVMWNNCACSYKHFLRRREWRVATQQPA